MTTPTSEATSSSLATRLSHWLSAFWPAPVQVNAQERLRGVVGAVLGVLFAACLSRLFGEGDPAVPWLVAPIGASAVLVFGVPASPLAQPWSVVGGNTVSALVGIACANLIHEPAVAGAVAVSLAIAAMFSLRCLHPPGGAMALIAVLTHATGFHWAVFPALTNSALLVAAGIAYNSATGRRYPHVQAPVRPGTPGAPPARFSSADIDVVLSRYNQVLDISRGDLENLLQAAEMEAYRRQLGEIRCADIMSRELISVEFGTSLQDAWTLLRKHGVKALPVVDKLNRIVGILTLADFMRHAKLDLHEGFGERLRDFIKRTTTMHSDKPEVVGQIMTRQVRVASADRHVVELMPLFSEGGHHHIPIIGEKNRLVGIITQSDFVKALHRAVL
ncbi:HPP family protein [Aquabacterium sp.]|uniref:HPP family protein n=1 Tax=Aquabacterium sp. TaxID=1872578 RepID=UPI003D6DA0C1